MLTDGVAQRGHSSQKTCPSLSGEGHDSLGAVKVRGNKNTSRSQVAFIIKFSRSTERFRESQAAAKPNALALLQMGIPFADGQSQASGKGLLYLTSYQPFRVEVDTQSVAAVNCLHPAFDG